VWAQAERLHKTVPVVVVVRGVDCKWMMFVMKVVLVFVLLYLILEISVVCVVG